MLRWITLSSFLFWFIWYWKGGKEILADIQNSLHSSTSSLDTILLITISLCSVGIVGTGVLASLRLLPIVLSQNVAITFIGMLLSVSGIMGMFYCRLHLGRFWTAETDVANDHQVVDTGPYRFARHPIYTFAIMMYIGLSMVFLWLWNVVLAGIVIVAYILKARDEDRYLEQNLAGYQEYKQRVHYYLLPGLW